MFANGGNGVHLQRLIRSEVRPEPQCHHTMGRRKGGQREEQKAARAGVAVDEDPGGPAGQSGSGGG